MKNSVRRHLIFWSVACSGLLLDLLTKYAAFSSLGHPDSPETHVYSLLGKTLQLQTACNKGSLFGLGSGQNITNLLICLTVVMSAMVLYWYLVPPKENRNRPVLHSLGLGLVFGGAIGNLFDRVVFGMVRDFIAIDLGFYRWPNFNLADVWLTIGILLYMCLLFFGSRKNQSVPAPSTSADVSENSSDEKTSPQDQQLSEANATQEESL
jgi:signal peptidase II